MYFSHKLHFIVVLALALIFPPPAKAHRCNDEFQSETNKVNITQHCRKRLLGAEFAWNFDNTTGRLDVAFGARLDGKTGWLAWGLNPHGAHMVGTRALIGIKNQNGSLEAHQYNVTYEAIIGCPLLPVDDMGLNVSDFRFVYWKGIGYHVILASLVLPREYNGSRADVVWQIGEAAAPGGQPFKHPKNIRNLNTAETVDLVAGRVVSMTADHKRMLRTIHGVVNIVGWGTLLPIGAIVARYFRSFPKEWEWSYFFHRNCQGAGYIIGSSGWAVGLLLSNAAKYYDFRTHRIIGIVIFTFSTIQMLALRLMPKESDEYRKYWNIYHHFLGYALLGLISVNIFVGIKILDLHPAAWKWAYIGILGVLGSVALAFEVSSWFIWGIENKWGMEKKCGTPEVAEDLKILPESDPVSQKPESANQSDAVSNKN